MCLFERRYLDLQQKLCYAVSDFAPSPGSRPILNPISCCQCRPLPPAGALVLSLLPWLTRCVGTSPPMTSVHACNTYIRHRYAICVVDINVNHEHILSVNQSCRELDLLDLTLLLVIQEPPGVYWNYCVYPITRMIYPGLPKVMSILWLTHSAPVKQSDNLFLFLLILLYSIVPTLLCTNTWYTHMSIEGSWRHGAHSLFDRFCFSSFWASTHTVHIKWTVWGRCMV